MFDRLQNIISLVKNDPISGLIYIVTFACALLLSLILHEIAHGCVALWCGDPTAKRMGRLSLDPRKHLDPVGTLFMVFLGFGWAKPVPVNPRNYKHYRRDDLFVSLAGIVMNLLLFVVTLGIGVLILKLMLEPTLFNYYANTKSDWYFIYSYVEYFDSSLKTTLVEYLKTPWLQYVFQFFSLMASFNICLAVFNLIPIPPLDGYHVLNDVLFKGRLSMSEQMWYGLRILLFVLCMTGALGGFLNKAIDAIQTPLLNLFISIIF